MINMAAWIPKVVRVTKNQNVGPVTYAVQSYDYSSQPRVIKNPTMANLKRGTGGRSSFNGIVCTIFGCSGFIGNSLSIRLGKTGTQLILPHRCDPYHIRELKVGGDLGQVYYHPFDLKDEESIIRSIKYSNVVINLIGQTYETSNFSFDDVHVEGARTLARLAKKCNVERFIHMSCLNAEEKPTPMIIQDGSKMLKSKWRGEVAVREEFPEATIVRPSVIYGRMDKFVSHYMSADRTTFEYIPLWHKGEKTEKQPVYIHDVISGLVAIIRNPDTAGKTYQFVGSERFKLNNLVNMMFEIKMKYVGNNMLVSDMKINPYFWLKTTFAELIAPVHPTIDLSWEILEFHHASDKIDPNLPTLEDLGITPVDFKKVIPWEVEPYVMNRLEAEELQVTVPPEVKSVPK
ncbi:NADH dehydrogenase [ubiquinone] 1 alpha subcomplex subunit 9, mitochondrial isoform X1 [Bombus terrestris]|uniref:NADH dehydrogenase [ubiquinone] 1 alpha subcomplex subunit 9, mitochondrial n=2 Tax=Bombus terrestris TaxID=30195 RepID=A0A9B0CGP6_BOMTE|nr:NADH dehydrogenase [ubiquinone] 1 alpha subcomplex subunit 9, mitochondrial isoform X1 [Bombus terrestris]